MKTDQNPVSIHSMDSLRAGLESLTNQPRSQVTEQVIQEVLQAIDATRQCLNALEQALQKLPAVFAVIPPAAAIAPKAAPVRPVRPRLVPSKPTLPAPQPKQEKLPQGRGPQAILDALAWWEMVGVKQPLRQQVAFIAGYTVNGHFNNLTGQLRTYGHLDYPAGNRLCLTPTGRVYADFPVTPPTRQALHARVREKLNGAQTKLFDVLLTYEGETITSEDLARRAGYTVNGHFSNTRGSLRSLQIVEYERGGTRLADWLYPAELPE